MILLIGFAFLAGVVTILSPCILPILPIILTSTIGGQDIGKGRPIGVVIGFVLSFTFFTLFLSTIVRISGLSADFLRVFSVVVIAGFGISFLIPQFQKILEILFSKLASFMPQSNNRTGFFGGIIIGLSLGLLWTPCVGPILASVISLALTGSVTLDAFFITFAYALGTAIPMFLIMLGGQSALRRVPFLLRNTSNIQKAFGVLMILTAIGIFFNIDRKFQTFILDKFPQYGVGLTKFEDNQSVRKQLENIGGKSNDEDMGKPTFDMNQKGPVAPEIIPGGEWFNTSPLTLEELRGKVVIVDFWTYSCINCQRTLPYLKDWYEKYKDRGLVIIGVHAPEFEFEKNKNNVKNAIEDFGIEYPVVQDNQFATWRAYENHYWPAKYIIDKNGQIRYTHFGEGAYDETEKIIQELLSEDGEKVSEDISNPTYEVVAQTPETYLGYGRISNFSSNEEISTNQPFIYTAPANIADNSFAYIGEWTVMDEYATAKTGSELILNFEARNVYLVMRKNGGNGRVKVLVDDKLQFFGEDNVNGIVTVAEDSLYKIVKIDQSGRHLLRLQFLDPGIEVFAFTFG